MTGTAAEITLTAALVASVTGGTLAAGEADRVFASVAIDTRTLTPGALFVALRGDRFDGAGFQRAGGRHSGRQG